MSQNSQHLPIGYILGGHYEIVEVLGQGGFGIVYKVKDRHQLNKILIVKELFIRIYSYRSVNHTTVYTQLGAKKLVEKIKKDIIREVNILSKVRNPHIVEAYGYFEENNTIYSVMEYIKGINLLEYSKLNPFNEEDVKDLLLQLIDGLKEVHALNIIHRDIKPSNIMRTNKGIYKLIDFTNSKFFTDHTITISRIKSEGYTAPELLKSRGRIGVYSDIYSLGMTIYYLLSKENPPTLADRTLDNSFNDEVDKLNISKELKICIKNMTHINFNKRLKSLDDIKKCLNLERKKQNSVKVDFQIEKEDKKKSKKTFMLLLPILGIIIGIGGYFGYKLNIFDKLNLNNNSSSNSSINITKKQKWNPLIYRGKRSYSKNSENTVKDNYTGLIWQKSNFSKEMLWVEARNYCKTLILDGYSDWRLPTIEELYYLADRTKFNPAIDTNFFNIESGMYWSSSKKSDSKGLWFVDFWNGEDIDFSSNDYAYVLCVR